MNSKEKWVTKEGFHLGKGTPLAKGNPLLASKQIVRDRRNKLRIENYGYCGT